MDSAAFKYKQNQHFNRSSSNNNNDSIGSHNHNNQNSIFILNAEANNDLPNNPQLYYLDLNVNKAASSFPSLATATATATTSSAASCTSGASSSMWSSASTTVCSPAAHAIQKLFNCSSNSLKLNHPNHNGIESKKFKAKSEILKKKSKFWKYLEGEGNDKNGKSNESKKLTSSFKNKSKYWSKSSESENQNQEDIAELLEYSCRLCDDCRCMDCQIGYFDCEDSDDSNSEYSFHLKAYEEDEQPFDDKDTEMELKTPKNACRSLKPLYEHCANREDNRSNETQKIQTDTKLTPNCGKELNDVKAECFPQCFIEHNKVDGEEGLSRHCDTATNRDH